MAVVKHTLCLLSLTDCFDYLFVTICHLLFIVDLSSKRFNSVDCEINDNAVFDNI